MSIGEIVADYETAKKAWDMGLRLVNIEYEFRTIFAWWRCLNDYEAEIVQQSEWDSEAKIFFHKMYPAPTAEEVPLPFSVSFKHKGYSYMLRQTHLYLTLENTSAPVSYEDKYSITLFPNPNEAISRFEMAIWLCEKVPEAREWYAVNGYLVDNND